MYLPRLAVLSCLFSMVMPAIASANILLITPTWGTLNVTRWEGTGPANPKISQLKSLIGLSATDPFMEIYKQDVGAATDSGSAAPFYSTTFANPANDPQDATITWDGPDFSLATYALVKGGNQTPSFYVFKLDGVWNGTDTICFQGFWPAQGAISHVTLFNSSTEMFRSFVPEPGTLAIWSLIGLVALGGSARRRKA